jgi:hypothetical protein
MKKIIAINLVYFLIFSNETEFVIKGNNKYIKKYAFKYQSLLIPKGKHDKKSIFKSKFDFIYKYKEKKVE